MKRALLILLAVALPRLAHADGEHGVIALLPLAADAKLALYGQPVASQVAKTLEQDGYSIVLVTSTAPVPSQARLVIDGRIVRGDGGAVRLEARVRDPRLGTVVGAVSSAAPTLTRIDEAATALSASLADVLAKGIAAQDAPKAPPVATATQPTAPTPPPDRRPPARVTMSAPAASNGDPSLEPLVRAGAVRLAGLLGHRVVDAPTADALSIEIDLLAIRYDEVGVITARARGRVRVSDGSGKVVFDRVVRTDTLVGGRGDRRDAVARAAIEQIVDVAMPRVREALKP